jgi:hypothetical protein
MNLARTSAALLAAIGLTAGLFVATVSAAPAKAPAKAPAPQVYRMTSFLAYEPDWYDAGSKMVFLANTQPGEPMHLFLWDLVAGKLARFSKYAAVRHSLVAHEGRAAYVERSTTPPSPDLAALDPAMDAYLPQTGPDMLMVQQPGTNDFKQAFRGYVLPGSATWSPDGRRLAFITMDRRGIHRLALIEPGQPAQLVQLDQDYQLSQAVSWLSAREVLLRARPLKPGPARLLKVGKVGINALPDGALPKLSPDGKWILVRATDTSGVSLRALNGGGRNLHPTATAYAWGAKANTVYVAASGDILALDAIGKVLRRWPQVSDAAVSYMSVSPDGRALAFGQENTLAVILLR